jgi:hypothetical protein
MSTQGNFVRPSFVIVNCLVCLLLTAVLCDGQHPHSSTVSHQGALKQFLREELGDPQFGIDQTTRFISAIIQSDGTAKEEVVVYIYGQSWCGSGGCRLWILEPGGATFKIIGQMTIVRPPIRVLRTKSHGHYDIGVWVQGGGIQPGYEALMRFDGKSYPNNPSVPPSQHLTGNVAGKVIITRNSEGELLYK